MRNTRVPVKDLNGNLRSAKASQQKKDAQAKADEIEKAHLAEYGAGENSVKQLAILRKATELAAQGRLTESETRQMLLDIHEVTTGEKLEVWTIRNWVAEWLARKEKTVKSGTMHLYKAASNSLMDYLGPKSDNRLETLTTSHLRKWRDAVKDEGRAGKTTNQYLKAVKGMLKIAWQEGIVLRNPADALEFLPEDDSIQREPFTVQEISALMNVADQEWLLVIGIGFYTGLRLTDITRLKWQAIDFEKKQITVTPRKQKKTMKHKKVLVLPIPEPLNEMILAYPAGETEDEPVFPTLVNLDSGGHQGLSVTFKEIMKKAGVDAKVKKVRDNTRQGAGATVSAKSFHSLRHSLVSTLANAGVSKELRQKITGHSSDSTHEGYTHLEIETLRIAMSEMPEIK